MRTPVPVMLTRGFVRPGLPVGAKEVLPSKVTCWFMLGSPRAYEESEGTYCCAILEV
jgi:hypothetical protein